MVSEQISPAMIDHDMLARMERFATNFPHYLQRLEKESQKISENIPKITLEIEEFKKIQDSLLPFLSETVKKSLKEETQELSDGMVQYFKNQIDSIVRDYGQKAAEMHHQYFDKIFVFKQEMDSTVAVFQKLLSLQKQRLTRKGLLICGIFCLSSMLTGLALYWFFPQNIYYSDPHTARNIIMGRAAWENIKQLSPKDQGLLLESMKKYMRK